MPQYTAQNRNSANQSVLYLILIKTNCTELREVTLGRSKKIKPNREHKKIHISAKREKGVNISPWWQRTPPRYRFSRAQKYTEITSYGRKVTDHEEEDISVCTLLCCTDDKSSQTCNCQQESKRFTAFLVLLSNWRNRQQCLN